MRLLYTTALYNDYVAKDIPITELDMSESAPTSADAELLQA